MQITVPLTPQSQSSRNPSRGSLTGGNPDMTPFVEVPLDPNWPDLVRATLASQPDEYFRNDFQGRLPSVQEKLARIEESVRLMTPLRVFVNNLYRVEIADTPRMAPTFIHLAIRRHDEGTCNEWADLQRIKNEIAGSEYEAIELFPAESRLVNTGNEYHLWVHSNPNFRFPVGWAQRRFVLPEPVKACNGPQRNAAPRDSLATPPQIPVGTFVMTPMGQKG